MSPSFDPNKDIPTLTGKVYVVTGGSAGIGFGIVAHLLQHSPAKIYLLSNKEEHAEEAQQELKKWGDAENIVEWVKCDLADLKMVDQVAEKLAAEKKIDGLILNAGLGVGPYAETKDGIDNHMQVNVISQLHLLMSLLPVLQATPNSRVVLQSSELHRPMTSDMYFKDLAEINTDIGAMKLYNRSKLAQVLIVRKLVEKAEKGELGFDPAKLKTEGPWMNATHPGAVKTDQQAQAIEAYGTAGKIGVKAVQPFMKSPIDGGCRSALFAATSEDIVKERIQGKYIVPDRKVTDVSKQAKDDERQENLWRLCETILRDRLGNVKWLESGDLLAREGVHGDTGHARAHGLS